ncbi:MAG TPA: M1 family aminopeptidase, partial [Gemmataceae bacterium]|nr:M1 family aminopeptidase [Gemmataceae bacterium]
VATFADWFGPVPYPQLTIAETHLGWHARSCPGLVLVDERVVALPSYAAGYAEYVVTQQIAQQWWGNAVGTDETTEPYLAAGFAAHAAHRLLDQTRGRNNSLIGDPTGRGWLPGVGRADFRMTMITDPSDPKGNKPSGGPVSDFEDPSRLWGLAAERGGKVFAMLEARIGEQAFLAFARRLADRYRGRILTTVDLEQELAEQTGLPWDSFFHAWIYGRGATDWAVEDVEVSRNASASHHVIVMVQQKGEITEPTILAVRLAGDKDYSLRLPIDPAAGELSFPETRARIEPLPDQRVRVTVDLPRPPEQVAVDPDGTLLDSDPTNNVWKPEVRWRFTPLYTFLDETDLTCACDRWNIIAGPWAFDANFDDPWFTRATILGARIGAYKTQEFQGGVYAGWRPDYRDLAAGVDFTLPHWPFAKTEVGFNVEHHIADLAEGGAGLNRIAVYGRYIFDDTASFYLPPVHYVETFLAHQNNFLPEPRYPEPDGIRFNNMTDVGLHYHLDLLTPYWDPDRGVRVDLTVAGGLAVQPWREGADSRGSGQAVGQVSWVQAPPECLGILSETRLAGRLYGAAALPDRGEFYSLGGNLLFRGFDLKQRQGADVWVASAEWRVPLLRRLDWDMADHTVGLRQVALAPFYDVGNAYIAGHGLGPIAQAVGCGLRLDVAWLSFVERTTLRFDVAKTINASTPTQFWFGIQHPF